MAVSQHTGEHAEKCRVQSAGHNRDHAYRPHAPLIRQGPAAKPLNQRLAAVCAQSVADAQRLRSLGARTVDVTGNLKFDVTPDRTQLAAGAAWRKSVGRSIILLASTREGEDREYFFRFSPDAYAVGIDVVLYAMTH